MIHRADHKKDFLPLKTETARDSRLSLEARGLLVYMLTMKDNWKFSVEGLIHSTNQPKCKILKLVTELKKAGYIRQKRTQDKRGIFTACEWDVFETPQTTVLKNHTMEKPQYGETTVWRNHSADNPQSGKSEHISNINLEEISISKKYQSNDIEENHKRRPLGFFKNVFLSNAERDELDEIIGRENTGRYIDLLSFYLKDHPETNYPDHKKTIIRWFTKNEQPAPVTKLSSDKAEGEAK